MVNHMGEVTKNFCLDNQRLANKAFWSYFILSTGTFILSLGASKLELLFGSFFQILSVQLLLALLIIWMRASEDWVPLWGGKKAIFYIVILGLSYWCLLWAGDFLSHFYQKTDQSSVGWKSPLTLYSFTMSCLIAPFLEELFFRDILFRSLIARWGSVWVAAIISSLAFMAAHLSFYPGAFLLGLLSCALFVKSKSLWVCILFHSLSNASLWVIPEYFPALSRSIAEFSLIHFFYR